MKRHIYAPSRVAMLRWRDPGLVSLPDLAMTATMISIEISRGSAPSIVLVIAGISLRDAGPAPVVRSQPFERLAVVFGGGVRCPRLGRVHAGG